MNSDVNTDANADAKAHPCKFRDPFIIILNYDGIYNRHETVHNCLKSINARCMNVGVSFI